MNILIIAEHDGQHLNPATAKCLSCAGQFGAEQIDIVVLAESAAAVAEQAAALDGVNRVISIEDAAFSQPLAALMAPEVVALADDYSHLLGPSTTFGKDLMPRVAALLGVNQVSDIMAVDGPYEFKRPIYAGNAITSVQAPTDLTVVATVRTASYAAAGNGGAAAIEQRGPIAGRPDYTRFISTQTGGGDRPDLQTANVVISGGRALASQENFNLIFNLAEQLGAGVGASRAAVDAGYVPNELQVGQTGKIIAPDLYIAFGISGAIQHITGIKDAGTIVAINKDADAPIFEIADIGLVGDLFQIIPEIQAALD